MEKTTEELEKELLNLAWQKANVSRNPELMNDKDYRKLKKRIVDIDIELRARESDNKGNPDHCCCFCEKSEINGGGCNYECDKSFVNDCSDKKECKPCKYNFVSITKGE